MKVAALALALLLPAAPVLAENVDAGRTLAQTWCKGCHDVAPGTRTMHDTGAPPFAVVADSKGTTARGLTTFLYTSHNRMPDYSLTRQQVADVSAYIMSLKTQERAASGR